MNLFAHLLHTFINYVSEHNGGVCHIIVNGSAVPANLPHVRSHVKDGVIRLSVGPNAVRNWVYGDNSFSFNCRLAGMDTYLDIPYSDVLYIVDGGSASGLLFELAATGISHIQTDKGVVQVPVLVKPEVVVQEPPTDLDKPSTGSNDQKRDRSHLKLV
jgi:stringent starvation protein B